MARRKGTDRAWDAALAEVTAPRARAGAKAEGAAAEAGTLFAAIPKADLEDLRDLARRLSRSRGERVTLSTLAAEAVRDLLAKHRKQAR